MNFEPRKEVALHKEIPLPMDDGMLTEMNIKAGTNPLVAARFNRVYRAVELIFFLVNYGKWVGKIPKRVMGSKWRNFETEAILFQELYRRLGDAETLSTSFRERAEKIAGDWLAERPACSPLAMWRIGILFGHAFKGIPPAQWPDNIHRFESFVSAAERAANSANKLDPEPLTDPDFEE